MRRLTRDQRFRKMLAWLRKEFPAQHRVSVSRKILPRAYPYNGECDLLASPKRFQITLDNRSCQELVLECLVHEWAHALTWYNEQKEDDPHTSEWGVAYARIHRRCLEWNYGRGRPET